jgi:epidermal growth factor receptor substrate 15
MDLLSRCISSRRNWLVKMFLQRFLLHWFHLRCEELQLVHLHLGMYLNSHLSSNQQHLSQLETCSHSTMNRHQLLLLLSAQRRLVHFHPKQLGQRHPRHSAARRTQLHPPRPCLLPYPIHSVPLLLHLVCFGLSYINTHPDLCHLASQSRDFLSDDDDNAGSQGLHDKSAEIGNVQNQFNSTNRSLETAKADRQKVEQNLAEQAAQLSSLQTQLSSAKAAYETETKLLSTLRERLSNQSADIQKTREELIRSESDLSAVRVEKAEVEQAFLRDKEEARDLHRKMIEAGQQADAIKAEVEKVKRDAKQQKGMLAVARKQLAAKESDRSKAQAELDEANVELDSTTKEREEVEAELAKEEPAPIAIPAPERAFSQDSVTFAASQALPATPDLGSPSVASTKSNNPFERLQQTSSPRSGSPFLPFAGSAAPSPPPATNGHAAHASEDEDPFGLSQALEKNEPLKPAEPAKPAVNTDTTDAASESTPTVTPTVVSIPEATADDLAALGSPSTSAGDTDDFTTPPTTASGLPGSADRGNTLDTATAKFPAITESSPERPIPGSLASPTQENSAETNLDTQLKDLDVEESDSDSDSEDEIPLAKIADEKRASLRGSKQLSPEAPKTQTKGTFDDIFGGEAAAPLQDNAAPAPATAQDSVDAFGMPIEKSSSPFASANGSATSAPAQQPAGVDAFDQAMGNISPAPAGTNNSFSFESAFDDTFDFGSTSNETPFTPAPVNGAVNGTDAKPQQTAATKDDGFDSLFTSAPSTNGIASTQTPTSTTQPSASPFPAPSTSTPVVAPAVAPTTGETKPADGNGLSFDEVFSGLDSGSGPSLNLDGNQAAVKAPQSPTQQPFPASASSPPRNVTTPPPRSESPGVRTQSPPPRVSSPKAPRPSTSSSEKAFERPPPQPTSRHSKLSVG